METTIKTKSVWTSLLVSIGAVFQILAIKGPLRLMGKYPEYAILFLLLAIFWGLIGYFLFKSSNLMKEESTLRKGSLRALIFSVLGLNILSLIGAVCGLIKSMKKVKN